MVRIGLDSFSYMVHLSEGAWDAMRFLDRVVELGLDGCQFDPMHLDGWNPDLVRRIGAFCSDNGLYLELGSGGFDYERLSVRLEMAADAGARALRTFIGGERHETSPELREQLIGWTTENFARLAEVAERVGAPLVLENHEDLTSEEVLRILDAVGSPFIRALVDNGNALPVGEDPVECTRRLAPYAAATHLKDWKLRWVDGVPMREGCGLGGGDARPEECYRILRAAQPDMPITLEIPSIRFDRSRQSLAEEDANVVESVRFVRALEK